MIRVDPSLDVLRSLPGVEIPGVEVPRRELGATVAPAGISFADVLGEAVHAAAETGRTAATKAEALAAGAIDDLHGTMISAKEAEISLRLVGTIRNKLLDAFHEIWRTSV